MKRFRLFLSIVGLVFGVAVVGTSLSSASQAHSQEGTEFSSKKLYFSDEILPDHLLYPFLAASDRARLELAMPADKIYLQLGYGQRRFNYAQVLLDEDNRALALTTLTKSQKYFNSAAAGSLEGDFSVDLNKYVLNALDYHLQEVKEIQEKFSPHDRDVIEKLCDETRVLKDKLGESL